MTHDVERVLADINADHGDRCVEFLRHGVLLVLSAPSELLVLAGPEHGRTIPLTDLILTPNPVVTACCASSTTGDPAPNRYLVRQDEASFTLVVQSGGVPRLLNPSSIAQPTFLPRDLSLSRRSR